MITAQQLIDAIIVREGSTYTNDPTDKGGPTKYGITLATLSQYRGKPCTAADVEALEEPEARACYESLYVAPFKALPGMTDSLLGLLVDSGVQHGTGRAMKWLQAAGAEDPYASVLKTRIKFYARIIHDDPTQVKYINGWFNRACEFVR